MCKKGVYRKYPNRIWITFVGNVLYLKQILLDILGGLNFTHLKPFDLF